jgi:hypothetical protein
MAASEESDQFNPFAGLTSSLVGTAPDIRCQIYSQLTKWSDIQNMGKALARPQLQDELYACIQEIDFSDGRPLVKRFKNWYVAHDTEVMSQEALKAVSDEVQEFVQLRDKFTGLREYRLPWLERKFMTKIREYIKFYERIIDDPSARFIEVDFKKLAEEKYPKRFQPHVPATQLQEAHQERTRKIHEKVIQWLYKVLRVRLEKWGTEFCVSIVKYSSHDLCWVDGTVSIDSYLLRRLYNYVVNGNLPPLRANHLILGNLDIEKVTFLGGTTPLKINLDLIFEDLQEITFDMGGPKRYVIPIGSKVHTINAAFSLTEFFLTPKKYFEWSKALYQRWGYDKSSYPQVTHFNIPIPREELERWKYLFPNVPTNSFKFITTEQIERFRKFSDRVIDLKEGQKRYEDALNKIEKNNSPETQDYLVRTKRTLVNIEEVLKELDEWNQRVSTLDKLNDAIEYFNPRRSMK